MTAQLLLTALPCQAGLPQLLYPAGLRPNQLPFPADPVFPNFPPLLAWSSLTALLCRVDCPQLPSLVGLVPSNFHPLLAILCPLGGRIFDHMGAAILCVGVMVNLHITLLLFRIEAWVRGSWFALKGFLDQGGSSLGVWGSLNEGPVVVCRPATHPSHPSRYPGIWKLFTLYN